MNKKKILVIGSISAVVVIGFILFKKFKPKKTTVNESKLEEKIEKLKEKTKEEIVNKVSLIKLPKQECLKRGGRYVFGTCMGAK